MPLIVLEIAFVLCWSSGYVTAEFAIAGSAPFTVLFVRYIAATALLGGWIALRGQHIPRAWRPLLRIATVGILANAVWLAALFLALDAGVTSGTGALLTSLQPVATILLALATGRGGVGARQGAGLSLGLAGVWLVVGRDAALLSAPLWAYALPLVSVAAIAVSYVVNRAETVPVALPVRLAVQFAASALVLAPFAAAEGFPLRPDPVVLAAFAWQIGVCSIAAYGLMWAILDRSGPLRTSALMPLMPPVTLAMSWLLLDEPLGWTKLVGFACAVAGVALLRARDTRAVRG